MKLVLVESPTKARTLARYLGTEYQIEATYGHIRDLPPKKLGVDTRHNFAPEYIIPKDKSKRANELKTHAAKAETILLATDPDREGEAIAFHVQQIISDKTKGKPYHRIVFHEITKQAILAAIDKPRSLNNNLVDAQQARRVLDRLVGYKLSPLLWRKIRAGLSAGRVQSVAVKLIVDREKERNAFKPVEYWEIFSELESSNTQLDPRRLTVKLEKINDVKAEIGNEKEAAKVLTVLKSRPHTVCSVEKKEAYRAPLPPFTTSTLQQAAARIMGWSSKKTMMHAQKLYEQGLITYHRTDSLTLSQLALTMGKDYIQRRYGSKYLPAKVRVYKTKSKVAQEAHEAIRPTDVSKTKEEISTTTELGRGDIRLYELIWQRFVACQMADAIFDRTKIEVMVTSRDNKQTYLSVARGEIEKFDGWRTVMPKGVAEEDTALPALHEQEVLEVIKIDPQQKFTQPPARYSEAGLIKKLESEEIGRPSTYAPIISTIQDRHYVEKEEGRFFPTDLGITVNDFLEAHFTSILDLQFTARMEDQLDAIANGKAQWEKVITDFYTPFNKTLGVVTKTADKVKVPVEQTEEECPECGKGKLVIRIGRFGKFFACERFPDCKYSRNYVEKAGIACPDCGGEIIIKTTRRGKRFYGCSNYPDCKFAAWKKQDIPTAPSEQPPAASTQ